MTSRARILSSILTVNTSVDSNTLYIDADNNRVGINTGTPTQTLSISGNTSVTGTILVGSNVQLSTSQLFIGNSTVNTVITSALLSGNGASVTSVDAVSVGGNSVLTLLAASNTAYTNAVSQANTLAFNFGANAYANAILFASNATNVNTGTLDTARLPATANISTGINVGANVNLSTTQINVGNSTVNTVITSTSINTNGTLTANTIVVGNVEQTQTNLQVDPAGTAFLNALIYG